MAPEGTRSISTQMDRPSLLEDRLQQIRSSPKLQSQQHTAVVLKAVEDTLRDQKSQFTPASYFAALLALASRPLKDEASSAAIFYLLDLVTPSVSQGLLRQKFVTILADLVPSLDTEAAAPAARSAIGVLESLLLAQDSQAWALPQIQTSPRKALALLLHLAVDTRPKIRKRAQESISKVLQNAPPGPLLDHPAADMCAETSLNHFKDLVSLHSQSKGPQSSQTFQQEPHMIHAMQLMKTVATASDGWPNRSLDSLLESLFPVARSRSEFLTMAAFDVFEVVIQGMATDATFSKLPRLLDAIIDMQPSQNDSQLLPPWIAILSRGFEVSAQLEPVETFAKLPNVFEKVSSFLPSVSYNIRVSASECLVSFLVNCIPDEAILSPSVYDEKTLEKLCAIVSNLLNVKYQSAWMEVFTVLESMLACLRWKSFPLLKDAVTTVGELRIDRAFQSKDKADLILAKAIRFMGPEAFLSILPLNLNVTSSAQQGRAWLLPLLRDNVENADLNHFKSELIPLSEALHQKIMTQPSDQKTMEGKIFETLVQQIWECLPGYCTLPLDVQTAFDQDFAEMLSTLLYQRPEMRLGLCRALQNLVTTLQAVMQAEADSDLTLFCRIPRSDAQKALDHLATFASNLLAVLFNVYSETATHQRGPVLSCIDSYLSITKPTELVDTFDRVSAMLDTSIKEAAAAKGAKEKQLKDKTNRSTGSMSHDLMDIIVAISIYLPRGSFQTLFTVASVVVSQSQDPQLQKKAYKIIPRLAQSENGKAALQERNSELRQLLTANTESVLIPARKDRFNAISQVIDTLPSQELSFIATVLPEIILGTKETNERARGAAFDLIVQMGEKMQQGGSIVDDSTATNASIDEYFTMLSAGLAGTTPHMISASVTAISRALFHFRPALSQQTLNDLIQTMDLFLESPTREVVRSVLGFIKICVLSVPQEVMLPRLPSLVPHLMSWSHEHKAHFRSKVKNILERMVKRYGFDAVASYCPEDDKKLLSNIRKTRERRKRQKTAAAATETEGQDARPPTPAEPTKARYGNEFDDAIYGSDSSDDSSAASDDETMELRTNKQQRGKRANKGGEKYIHEDPSEPLDLLSKKALANISSTRPIKAKTAPRKRKAKTDEDGKLVLGDDDDDNDGDAQMIDFEPPRTRAPKTGVPAGTIDDKDDLMGGINAYVDAIRGRDAAQRGQRGRLKFKNRPRDDARDEEDAGEPAARPPVSNTRGFARGGRGAVKFQRQQRRPLEGEKTRGGRVMKRGFGGRRR
ncbi:MAG: hypothetical protein M1828_007464 [Chrysothrix sp. TS-e1954]|nr:MAG: hypothetical protein M1828_007464 [Chrysothrix sp. TS-e1954]